eukprot:2996555-Prymnesium_polylepis.1
MALLGAVLLSGALTATARPTPVAGEADVELKQKRSAHRVGGDTMEEFKVGGLGEPGTIDGIGSVAQYKARPMVDHAAESPYQFNNDLLKHFDTISKGPVVWKWRHYFMVYERHLRRFRGTDVHFCEVGVFSGGSMRMWRWYFGPKATIYGVDFTNKTKVCELNPNCGSPKRVFIGDQGSPEFWQDFKRQVPRLDVILDDGGHLPHLQNVTLHEIYPHLSRGGVYLTEDLHGRSHPFADYVYQQFVSSKMGLNNVPSKKTSHAAYPVSLIQLQTAEVAFYHYMLVIEKRPSFTNFRSGAVINLHHGTTTDPPANRTLTPISG